MGPETIFRIVDVAGVIGNAVLGSGVARSRDFDVIGFILLAIISGLGGGMMRDALLGVGFPVALTDPLYLSSAVVVAVFAYVINLSGKLAARTAIVADALVVGCWSATGAAKAVSAGLGFLPAVFLGVLTAIGGGMLRSIAVGEIPSVFGGSPVYATVSVLGASEMVLMARSGHYELGMGIAIGLCGVLIVLARRRRWILPSAARLNSSISRFPATLRNSASRIRRRK